MRIPNIREQKPLTSDSSIYDSQRGHTSKVSSRNQAALFGCIGAALGGATWLCLALLGVPNVFHLSRLIGLVPSAIIGALICVSRFRNAVVVIFAAVFVFLLIAAYTPLFSSPARSFIRVDPLPSSADAVVVLSAGVTPDGFLNQQGLDRLLKGLALVRNRVAPRLLVTREKRDVKDRQVTTAGDQDALAALAGVTDVVSTPLEASTHDEALAVKKIAASSGWKRIILVTSPFHTRRACATFEHVGLTVSCIPSDSRDIAVHSLEFPDDRVNAFGMWLYETAATLQYKRRGWI